MDYDKLLSLTEKDKKYKFELEICEETFSDTLPEGQITRQYPLAGEIIEALSLIHILQKPVGVLGEKVLADGVLALGRRRQPDQIKSGIGDKGRKGQAFQPRRTETFE